MYKALPKNKVNIRKSFCRLVFFCWCLPYKRPTVGSQHICVPFATVSFFPFGIYPDATFHHARQRRLPYFPEKIQVGLQEMGFPRHVAPHGKVREKQVLHDFYVVFWFFLFPKSCCTLFKTRPRLFSPHHSIYFWSGGLGKPVLLEDRRKCLLLSWFSLMLGNFCLK